MKHTMIASALTLALATPALAEDITVGFAIAKSGWMEAYDTPAATAANIRIDEINADGGLLGKQIHGVLIADHESDAEHAGNGYKNEEPKAQRQGHRHGSVPSRLI